MLPEGNIFPTAELYDRLTRLKSEEAYKYLGVAGTLYHSSDCTYNGVKFAPDVEGKLNPLFSFDIKTGKIEMGLL